MTLPPHLQALVRLKKARVDFMLVGALALDHFVPEIASVYLTADCDILVRPAFTHLKRALNALESSGYALSVNAEPVIDLDALVVRRLLEYRITTRATKEGSLPIDLMVDAIGFPFEQWWNKRTHFKAGGASIPCACIEHVIESKKRAGRKKDRLLLRLFADAAKASPAPPKSRPKA